MTKNAFQQYIICLYLKPFTKIHIFLDKTVKNGSLSYLVLRAGPTRTRNLKLRPLSDLFRCHEFNGGLRIGKKTFIENHVFEVRTIISIYVKFNNWISKALFWEPSILLDSCWQVGFNFELESLFWLMGENLIFWMILPLWSEIWK